MEMLTFRLTDNQLYGINVFKIIEIIDCPRKINRMPLSHPAVKGAVDFRGKPISVIDLSQAVGLDEKDYFHYQSSLIICEYSRQLTAFIIDSPEMLITRSWSDIHKPEEVHSEVLVAIAYSDDNEAILLLDIESILAEVTCLDYELSTTSNQRTGRDWSSLHILLVDDSRTALMMLQSLLDRMRCHHTSVQSALQAIHYLSTVAKTGSKSIDLVISDIEMPGMDGFTLARTIRDTPYLRDIKIMLHSSMSNPSNRIKAEQSGANEFVAKFDPDVLAERIAALCGVA
jgi:two-component system chemotaxis response regulator CheV